MDPIPKLEKKDLHEHATASVSILLNNLTWAWNWKILNRLRCNTEAIYIRTYL